MLKKYIYEIILLIAILLFVVFKIPHLSLPLFWDEMGVYGKAVFYLLEHKISIFPGDLDPELSRGHPMFFVFITAFWMNIFGETIISGHLFILFISITFVITSYFFGKKHISKNVGLLTALFILIQPVFNAQSILILPEVMLGLFLLLGVHFALCKQYFLYFLFGSLALLTKETAIILPFALLISNIIYKRKIDSFKSLIILSPILSFIGFLFIQKVQNGWFLFPYHTSLIKLEAKYILKTAFNTLYFLFVAQGRFAITMATSLALIIEIKKNGLNILKDKLITVCFSIFFFMFSFSIINFYMTRYFILLLPFIGLASFRVLEKNIKFRLINYGCVGLLILTPLLFLENKNKFNYDSDLGYIRAIKNIKETTKFIEKNTTKMDRIYCDFPLFSAFEDKKYGYLKYNNKIKRTSYWGDSWKYAIITYPSNYQAQIQDSSIVQLVQFHKNEFTNTKIYRRKKN